MTLILPARVGGGRFVGADAYVVRKARHLAQAFQAKLSIIHVLDNIPMPDTAYGTIVPLDKDSPYEMLEAVKIEIAQLGERMAIELERRWMVWGVPGEEIVRIAEQERRRLIIVGSHGRHGLGLLHGIDGEQRAASCSDATSWQIRFPEEVDAGCNRYRDTCAKSNRLNGSAELHRHRLHREAIFSEVVNQCRLDQNFHQALHHRSPLESGIENWLSGKFFFITLRGVIAQIRHTQLVICLYHDKQVLPPSRESEDIP